MNIDRMKIEQLKLKSTAYHRLAEALDRLRDFYYIYADYLDTLADAKKICLKEEEERRRP